MRFTMTTARNKITDLDTVPEARYIYESPDSGLTIFAREVGSSEKVMVSQDPTIAYRNKIAKRSNRLLTILKLSETDNTLNDALEALETLYIIKYGDDKDN